MAHWIGHDDRPGVCGSGLRPAVPLPGLRHGIMGILRDWVPTPAKRAGAGIERADQPAWALHSIVIRDTGAYDHQVVDDRRRRGLLILALPDDVLDSTRQVDLAGDAEVGARLAGRGIQADQARVDGSDIDPPPVTAARPAVVPT